MTDYMLFHRRQQTLTLLRGPPDLAVVPAILNTNSLSHYQLLRNSVLTDFSVNKMSVHSHMVGSYSDSEPTVTLAGMLGCTQWCFELNSDVGILTSLG